MYLPITSCSTSHVASHLAWWDQYSSHRNKLTTKLPYILSQNSNWYHSVREIWFQLDILCYHSLNRICNTLLNMPTRDTIGTSDTLSSKACRLPCHPTAESHMVTKVTQNYMSSFTESDSLLLELHEITLFHNFRILDPFLFLFT